MRFRLLNGPHEKTERMIAQYPEHLPLKRARVVIPTVEELKKRERNGEVVLKEAKLLSKEVERVCATMTIKEEKHSGKGYQNEFCAVQLTAQPSRREFYKVCRQCTDFVVNYPVQSWLSSILKVHFTEVLRLVRHREVIVKGVSIFLAQIHRLGNVTYKSVFHPLLRRATLTFPLTTTGWSLCTYATSFAQFCHRIWW